MLCKRQIHPSAEKKVITKEGKIWSIRTGPFPVRSGGPQDCNRSRLWNLSYQLFLLANEKIMSYLSLLESRPGLLFSFSRSSFEDDCVPSVRHPSRLSVDSVCAVSVCPHVWLCSNE